MESQISSPYLFTCTAAEFQQQALAELGRGADQSLAIYKEWHRQGSLAAADPCFSNCPQLRQELLAWAACPLPRVVMQREDGACLKLVIALQDGLEIETVVIPMQAGETVCVSSQVGCAMGCAFCETGRMGLLRSLTPAEIVSQVWLVRHHLGRTPRNIVFMGMGEPFDNFDNVHQAIRVLTDPSGPGFGPRHITISTVGRVDGIRRMLDEMDPALHLALSLNAPSDQTRDRIMPMNKRFNMAALQEVLKEMTDRGRSVLVEYVLLREVNDQLEHADQVADFLHGLNVRVNCIPYNPQTRARFASPDDATIDSFMQRLRERGVPALLRHHKGRSAMAACGQLGNVGLRGQMRALKAAASAVTPHPTIGH